jgi:hypothetical protein
VKALIVIGIIVFVLFLIGLIRVGAEAAYDDQGFRLAVRFGFFRINLGGREKTNKRSHKKAAEPPGEAKPKKKLPSLPLLRSFASRAFELLCRTVRDLRIDVLKLHFTAAFDDPAVTALAYGAAGTAMDALQRIGGEHIVCSDMRADADFDSREPRYDFRVGARMRIGRLFGSAFRFGFGILFDVLREKRKERSHG